VSSVGLLTFENVWSDSLLYIPESGKFFGKCMARFWKITPVNFHCFNEEQLLYEGIVTFFNFSIFADFFRSGVGASILKRRNLVTGDYFDIENTKMLHNPRHEGVNLIHCEEN